MSAKPLLYDWGGYNTALFDLVYLGTPTGLTTLAWVASDLLGNYWLTPFVVIAFWGAAKLNADVTQALSITKRRDQLIVALGMAVLVTLFFKLFFDFSRPFALHDDTSSMRGSFPSGHSTYAFLVACALWYLSGERLRLVLVAYVGLVGWSRLALGKHFPADIVGGWILGALCWTLAAPLLNWLRIGFATPRWPSWYGLALAVTMVDQMTKGLAAGNLTQGAVLPVTVFLNLINVRNDGAAFSLLAGAGSWARYTLIALAFGVSVWMIKLLQGKLSRLEACGYSFVLGGAIGNLLDRVTRGAVVDFLDFHYAGMHWPAFNLADVAIVTGATLIVLSSVYSVAPLHQVARPSPLAKNTSDKHNA